MAALKARAVLGQTVFRTSSKCWHEPSRPLPSVHRTIRCMAAESSKADKATPDSEWRKILSAEEYYILRQKGTEPANSGKSFPKEPGTFLCAGCGAPLYKSEFKFDSGCGWPSFDDEIPGAIDRHEDNSYGMRRVEITCSNCGGHLGHEFAGERFTPKNVRHCVNSVSIKFDPEK